MKVNVTDTPSAINKVWQKEFETAAAATAAFPGRKPYQTRRVSSSFGLYKGSGGWRLL